MDVDDEKKEPLYLGGAQNDIHIMHTLATNNGTRAWTNPALFNIDTPRKILIRASSVKSSHRLQYNSIPSFAVSSFDYFESQNISNSWIEFDFRMRRVKLKSYSFHIPCCDNKNLKRFTQMVNGWKLEVCVHDDHSTEPILCKDSRN